MAADGSIKIDTKIDQKGIDTGIKTMQGKLKSTAGKLKSTGTKMSAAFTAPIVAVGGIAFAAADDIDQAYRNIRVGTGATGDALEELKEDFRDVFKNVPDDAATVSEALSNLNTMTGATGDVLNDLTTNVLDASRTLKEDGVENAAAFGKAMEQWQIPAEDGVGKLDKLYKITQDYGVGLGEISSHLTEYGSVLSNAGFSMDESADLMGRLEKGGISVSRIMPGLNMAFRNWASEGKDSRKEFDKTIEAMQGAETQTEALSIATEAFGAEGAQRLTTGIRTGAIPALDELGDTLQDSDGLIQETTNATETFGEKATRIWNNVKVGIEPLGRVLLDLADKIMPPVLNMVEKLAGWFDGLSSKTQMVTVVIGLLVAAIGPLLIIAGMVAGAISAISVVMIKVAAIVGAVIAVIGLLVAAFMYLWNTNEEFRDIILGIWQKIKEVGMSIFNTLKDAISEIFASIKETIQVVTEKLSALWAEWGDTILAYAEMIFNNIKIAIETVINVIKDIIGFVLAIIRGDWEEAWDRIESIASSIWSGIQKLIENSIEGARKIISKITSKISELMSKAWDKITSRAEDFKRVFLGIWSAIKSGIRKVINPIIGYMNGIIRGVENMVNGISSAINKIPSFDVPGWVPGIGGKTFGLPSIPSVSLPRIPSLDVGTNFVAADGLAYLHKGEAVVPREYNPAAGGEGGGVYEFNIEIPLDGETVAKKTVRFTSRELEKLNKTNARKHGVVY